MIISPRFDLDQSLNSKKPHWEHIQNANNTRVSRVEKSVLRRHPSMVWTWFTMLYLRFLISINHSQESLILSMNMIPWYESYESFHVSHSCESLILFVFINDTNIYQVWLFWTPNHSCVYLSFTMPVTCQKEWLLEEWRYWRCISIKLSLFYI